MGQSYLSDKRIDPEFLAQGASVQSKNAGGLALIALCVVHDSLEQWPFHFTDNEIVLVPRTIAV